MKQWRYIKNNIEKINYLFLDYLNVELDDRNYALNKEQIDDIMVCFTHEGRILRLLYDEWNDNYVLFHQNTNKNYKRNESAYHIQGRESSLIRMIEFINTLHSAKDMLRKIPNNKRNIVDKALEKYNRNRSENNKKNK